MFIIIIIIIIIITVTVLACNFVILGRFHPFTGHDGP